VKAGQVVFVSDKAISLGIREARFVDPVDQCKTAVHVSFDGGQGSFMWLKHVHETREAAIADADGQRNRKIAGLRKQIAKLEKVRFE